MPAIQTTYNQYHDPARAGMLATQEKNNIITRIVQDVAGIGYGVAVFQAPGVDKGITATPGTHFLGITVESEIAPAPLSGATPNTYAEFGAAKVNTDKTIWVVVASAVTAGQAVTVGATGASFGSATGTGNTVLPNAAYDTSAAAGGYAIVRLVGG